MPATETAPRRANDRGHGQLAKGVDMGQRTCSIGGCEKPHMGRGWCETHYNRWRRHGDPRILLRPKRVDPDRKVKPCGICRIVKPQSEFNSDASRPDGTHPYCRLCVNAQNSRRNRNSPAEKERRTARRYGLSVEEYRALANGVCGICHRKCPTHKRLSIDHDHKTGVVRGALCNNCNRGLGLLGDDVESLRSALAYLVEHDCG